MTGEKMDLLVIYPHLDPLCRANTKEHPERRSSEGEVTTKKCVQIGHGTRIGFDRGWKKEAGRGALTEHEIRQQPVPAAFATKTAFLVTPEWARGIKFVIGVRPNHPGAK